jgi:hypothetical protein
MTPNVFQTKRYRNVAARQRAYVQMLQCTTYDLCCHKHKDMMHAENCPIHAAEVELTKAEIEAIEADSTGNVLQNYRHASQMLGMSHMRHASGSAWCVADVLGGN